MKVFADRLYAQVLRLYPPEFREEFGGEMLAVFREAGGRRGGLGCAVFAARELLGLIAGAAAERLAPVAMRPPAFPCDIPSAERYIKIASRRVITAIAGHDFEAARFYDLQERKARALVALLRAQAG